MHVLGISAFYHDSAAALLTDGRIAAAAQEERFTRVKHDPGYPRHAIDACLRTAGITPDQLDLVCFYEKPLLKFDRILDTTMAVAPAGMKRWNDSLPGWFLEKLRVEDKVQAHLGYRGPFRYAGHHESHAASAFFVSPFEEAATLTTDGVGEWTTNAIGMGRGNRLELTHEIRFPHSMGLLYSAFTQYLGFRVNNGEYKVMGLAPYGQPRFVDVILAHLIDLRPDGSYRLRLEHFDYLAGDSTIAASFADLFGAPARAPESELTQHHMDVARSIQAVTEQVMLAQAAHAKALTGARYLCMAGGVALNSVANGKLVQSGLFDDVYVQPAAGDAGGALGAALVGWHHILGKPRELGDAYDGMSGALLGPAYGDDDVQRALAETGLTAERLDQDTLTDRVADLLVEGKVVGWHQGRMEFGPRALGGRTILADPRRPEMQPRVNAKIKFREGFRPFAPSVLAEHASEWFELDRRSPYMLLVVPVHPSKRKPITPEDEARFGLDKLWVDRSLIPAVTHVDDSARVQTVHADTNPRYHELISKFYARTGCPLVLNTSFNLRGEPPVCTPLDAMRTFLASGMDALAVGDHLVLRPEDATPTGVCPPPPVFPVVRSEADLRTFGLGGGLILLVLASLQVWWGHAEVGALLGVLAVALALPGAIAPRALEGVERQFGRVGKVIGRFNARLLLSVVYLLIVSPLGAFRRWVSGDPLAGPPADAPTFWEPFTNHPDDPARYERMF